MKGFRKHIAASASITTVFIVCALALAVSPLPVTEPAPQAFGSSRTVSLAGSLTALIEAVIAAGEEAPVDGSAVIRDDAEIPAQPAPATAAPAQASAQEPALAEEQVEPGDSAAQPDETDVHIAAPPPPPPFNAPIDLTGTFVTDVPPYISLAWDPNNQPRYLSHCLIYREVVEEPGDIVVVQSKRPTYDDRNITPGLTYRYWVTAVSKSGEESGPSNIIEVATQVMDPPAPPQGVVAAAIDPGVSLDWEPNGEANLAGYNVYLNRNGRWRKLNVEVLTDNHYYHEQGTAGQAYAVSAVNIFGIESAYSEVQAQAVVPVIYEDSDPAVSVEGFWAVERYSALSGGSHRVALETGARLHFTFTGRQVKLIAAKYWTCGDANIYIDGRLVTTVSLYNYERMFQVVVFSAPGLKYGEHVLTIEVVGSGNPETLFDLNFVNVDAFEVR